MIGTIDESTPGDGGRVIYSLSLVIADRATALAVGSALEFALNRIRPLHWESDKGQVVRAKIIDAIGSHAVRIHVAAMDVPPTGQASARAHLLEDVLLPIAAASEVTQLIIEQRSQAEDNEDRRVIRNRYRQQRDQCPNIRHTGKADPLVWAADAAAGLWSDILLGRSDGWLEKLAVRRRIAHASWLPQPH